MKISAETIMDYARERAKKLGLNGSAYEEAAYQLGVLASEISLALNNPTDMRELRHELEQMEELTNGKK